MLEKALSILATYRSEAGIGEQVTDWWAEVNVDENFAEKVGYFLNETTDYWQPSLVEQTENGAEFSFPSGQSINIEKHTGQWFLDLEHELFPLVGDEPDEIGQEIDVILRETGYDIELSERKIKW
jgi:hypothetical protein